jgi:hypothetical protein
MKKYFFLVLVVLASYCLSACNNEPSTSNNKTNVIDKDTMIQIFADMHLADAAVQGLKINSDSSKHLYQLYYSQIFNRYKINNAQFKNSVQYYTQHPDEMDAMYIKVIEELGAKQNN